VFVVAATCIVAGVTLANASGTRSTAYAVLTAHGSVQLISRAVPTANSLVLNGRISAWQAALGNKPSEWLLGRGVGKVGTAAARASSAFIPSSGKAQSQSTQAVDSGYFATIADVGLVGLAVLFALFARLTLLGTRAARRDQAAGWVALAMLASMMLDALTRASFTGFPTAFLGLLILGVALAAAQANEPTSAPRGGGVTI
jgi:hypothetical protein